MPPASQKILGARGLIILIALLSAFIPLSTDLYLPALPGMSVYFGVDAGRVNLTLTAFFIFYAAGTLIWGPLSDHYGRKPVLLAGLGLYVLGSALCAGASSIGMLILYRVLQAAGGSAAGTVATAIVKDVYSGKRRESVLAIVQSMVLISPAAAPVLGAFLLQVMPWRGIFWVLTGIGVLALAGSLTFEETLVQRTTGQLSHSLARLGTVLQNSKFTILLVYFSLSAVASLAFIASSTYIYQDGFHLSGQVYSYYFSANALGMISGPMLYLWLARRHHSETIIRAGFALSAASGVLVALFGNLQPWIFALCILPTSMVSSGLRPPASNWILEQQQGDTGAVSSLMGCTGLLMGSLGMQLIALPWGNTILALGILTFSIAAASLLAWPWVIRRVDRLPGPGGLPLPPAGLPDAS